MMARHKWLVTCGHSLIVGPHCLGQLAGPRRVSELPRAWLLAGSRGWVIPGSQPLLRPGSTGGDDASLEVGFELLLFLFCSSFGCRLQCALIRAPGSWDLCWSCWLTLLLQALTFAKGRGSWAASSMVDCCWGRTVLHTCVVVGSRFWVSHSWKPSTSST